MVRDRRPWVTPRVATRLTRQLADRPDLLERSDLRDTVRELRRLERILQEVDTRETNASARERIRSDALLGMARHWRTLRRYLDG